MARSYDVRDLVRLPRLDARGADALVTELLTQAKGKAMGPHVEGARLALEEAQKALKAAITARLQALPIADTQRARAADQAEDAAFSATYDWLNGFAKLPDTFDEAALARRLLQTLFRDGLKFTLLAYKLEWAEADARLQAIAEDASLEQAFTTLGGVIFLDNLRRAHAEYGEALGITNPKEVEQTTVLLSEPLAKVRDALRAYVLQVLAHGTDAASEETASALLAPLAAWESPTRAAKPAAAGAAATDGAPAVLTTSGA